jgi:hypothetical protein
MPNITISVTEEMRQKMEGHPEVRWSNAIRAAIDRKLEDFNEAEKLAKKSRLTESDVKTLSKKADKSISEHAKRLLHESNN